VENVAVIWYILWPFGAFSGHLVNFPLFGTLHQEKSGNPVCLSFKGSHRHANSQNFRLEIQFRNFFVASK
jgi:hypothetical protein